MYFLRAEQVFFGDRFCLLSKLAESNNMIEPSQEQVARLIQIYGIFLRKTTRISIKSSEDVREESVGSTRVVEYCDFFF